MKRSNVIVCRCPECGDTNCLDKCRTYDPMFGGEVKSIICTHCGNVVESETGDHNSVRYQLLKQMNQKMFEKQKG